MQEQVQELYKPVIVKKEVDGEHYYFVDDKFYPSVTKILDETVPKGYALLKWYADKGMEQAEKERDLAGDKGSRVHDACEKLVMHQEIKTYEELMNQQERKMVVSFMNWLAEFNPVIEGVEMVLASRDGYAGTLDFQMTIDPAVIFEKTKFKTDNPRWIVDLKTSNSVHASHFLQQIAYKKADLEMTGIERNTAILHLNKTIKGWTFYPELKIKDHILQLEDWTTVLNMYKLLQGGTIPEPPLKEVYPEVLKLEREYTKPTKATEEVDLPQAPKVNL